MLRLEGTHPFFGARAEHFPVYQERAEMPLDILRTARFAGRVCG